MRELRGAIHQLPRMTKLWVYGVGSQGKGFKDVI